MRRRLLSTPLGELTLLGDEVGLREIRFPGHEPPRSRWVEDPEAHAAAVDQLREYFAGTRRSFDLQLTPRGTLFQMNVWAALLEIPYGATISYGALAAQLGTPGAARAVGLANGSNPLPIVIPCHRVIGADGSLTGYGGGLERKRFLLRLEGVLPARASDQAALF